MAEILDDPNMVAVEAIVREGVDPSEFDRYVERVSRYVPDMDANVAGPGFRADRLAAIVVASDYTYLVGVGMLRSVDGSTESPGVFRQRTTPGTIDMVDSSTFALDQCGSEPPRIVRGSGEPTSTTIDVECGSIRLAVDMSTTPPQVEAIS